MQKFGWLGKGLFWLFFVGLFVSTLLFLYALLFGGQWLLFFWTAGLSLALFAAMKLLALRTLDDKHQLDVAALFSEVLGGAFGLAWMVLGGASVVLFFKALFFGGSWLDFLVCLLASAVCKWLTRYSLTTKEAALFKRELVEQGLTKGQARQFWIARAREIIQQRKSST